MLRAADLNLVPHLIKPTDATAKLWRRPLMAESGRLVL